MDWMERFIDEVLREVPKSGYRTRTVKELRDHMETQYRVLTEGGRTAEEAQEEVLRVMGKPERLQKEYQTAWLRTPRARAGRAVRRVCVIIEGCVIAGALHMVIAVLLLCLVFFMSDDFMRYVDPCDPQIVFLCLMMLFLLPFSVTGLYLHFCAGRERRPVTVVTAGLLAAWVSEKVVLILFCIQKPGLQELLEVVTRNPEIPQFTPTYLAVSFVGCILLGQFFGRFIERDEVETA